MKKQISFLSTTFLLLLSQAQAADFFFEKDESLPLVYVTAAFRGGSTQDPEGKYGTTDLMGNLMVRGTKTKSKQQIDLALDQMGGSIGFETRNEFIAFRGVVLSDQLPSFLTLLSEILTEPSFRTKELDRLKHEQSAQILNQLSQDRSLIRLRFDQVFFKGHPYSKPNEGKLEDIKNITLDDIDKQFQKLISQKNMIFLATGQASKSSFSDFISTIETKRDVKTTLDTIPEFSDASSKVRYVIFDKPDRTQTQVMIGQKGVAITNPEIDALQIANFAFGGSSFQARLMTELRVKRGWTYGAGSSFRFGSQPHSWKIGFFPKNADTAPAIKHTLKMIQDFQKKGLSEKEFNAARRSLVNSAGFIYDTPAKRLENKMVEVMFGLPSDYYKDFAERLTKLTLEDINKSLKTTLTPDRLMIGILGTASIIKPDLIKVLGVKETDIEVQDYLLE